jgi:hypothetical protein
MKILVALAFIAIVVSLASALFYMMRGGAQIESDTTAVSYTHLRAHETLS